MNTLPETICKPLLQESDLFAVFAHRPTEYWKHHLVAGDRITRDHLTRRSPNHLQVSYYVIRARGSLRYFLPVNGLALSWTNDIVLFPNVFAGSLQPSIVTIS